MNKALPSKYQPRLSLDAGMGAFFFWLIGLPAKIRTRELIAMARIGWAVTHGVRGETTVAAGAAASMPREAAAPAAAEPGADTALAGGPSRTAAVATFGRSFITARPPA